MLTVHATLFILMLSIAFWPLAYVKYTIMAPFAVTLSWLLFDGCALNTRNTDATRNEEISALVQKVFQIEKDSAGGLIFVAFMFVPTFICIRLLRVHQFCEHIVA